MKSLNTGDNLIESVLPRENDINFSFPLSDQLFLNEKLLSN